MRTQHSAILALGGLATIAGAARAQYNGDPGLDPRVAQYIQPPVHVEFRCNTGPTVMDSVPVTWPGGVVPVAFESGSLDSICLGAMDAWMFRSGTSPNVTFVLRDPANPAHNNFLYIATIPGNISGSYVGVTPGAWDPSLSSGPPPAQGQYVYRGTLVNTYVMAHEFCHALGFWHEHTRPDRDSYVTVHYDRVYPTAYQYNFDIQPDWVANSLNTPYDFDSVMHYAALSFINPSCNGGNLSCSVTTCTPLVARDDLGYGMYQCTMGQQSHLSTSDVQDMINVYGGRPRAVSFVGPYGSGGGTLSNPYTSPAQFGGGGDVYFQGGSQYNVQRGATFNTPGTWRKHSAGVAVIAAP